MSLRKRVDWLRVSKLSAVMAVIVSAFLLGRLPLRDETLSTTADPGYDNRTLDFSDATTRSAILRHERYLRDWKFDSLTCHQGQTTFRVVHEGGLGGGEHLIAELRVEGQAASMDVLVFKPSVTREEEPELAWKPMPSLHFKSTKIAGIQDQLTSILAAPMAPQLNYDHVDAARTVVEACRGGRYHFFVFSPDDDEDVEKVSRLARSILQLAGQERAAAWAPSL
jgi:hypothetical protein